MSFTVSLHDVCLQNCVFSPCRTVSIHSVCLSPSHGRPVQTDRPFPTELWVIGIQNHTNNRERASISGDIPCLLIPLFSTHQSSVAHTQSTARLLCMQRVGQPVPGGLGVAEKAGSSFLCMRRNLLQVCVFPPWWISVGIYDLSPRSWWGGDLSASIPAALHVNLRQGFTQQTTLVEIHILTRVGRGGIFAASALRDVSVGEQ